MIKDISTNRFVVFSKDKEKILTNKGFKDIEFINYSSPKLFSTSGDAKNAISNSYPDCIDDVIYVKVNVNYSFHEESDI